MRIDEHKLQLSGKIPARHRSESPRRINVLHLTARNRRKTMMHILLPRIRLLERRSGKLSIQRVSLPKSPSSQDEQTNERRAWTLRICNHQRTRRLIDRVCKATSFEETKERRLSMLQIYNQKIDRPGKRRASIDASDLQPLKDQKIDDQPTPPARRNVDVNLLLLKR